MTVVLLRQRKYPFFQINISQRIKTMRNNIQKHKFKILHYLLTPLKVNGITKLASRDDIRHVSLATQVVKQDVWGFMVLFFAFCI